MEDTTSEATTSYLSSQMPHATLDNQIIHADQWNSRQHTNSVVVHSQANQNQLIQGEPSEASDPRGRGRRPKLNADQRKEHKKQSCMKYREKEKKKANELSAETKRLQEENRQLSTENRRLQEENRRLSTEESRRLSTEENRRLQEDNRRLSTEENRRLQEENRRLNTENRSLHEENERLTFENRHLEEHVRGLQSRGKHPAENEQRQDSYISQSISLLDHQNVYTQDHHGMDSSNEAVYMDHRRMDSDIDGAMEVNDLGSLPLPENETNQNGEVAIHVSAPEHPASSLSGMSHFLMKLDEDVSSQVGFSDFTGLEGERTTVGRYSLPSSLIPTMQRIKEVRGDISAASRINPCAAGTIYVFFCATIKEMDDLQLDQVTEKKMLKWRDTIKDALRIDFNVRFAMEHLKKIARAYFGQTGCLLLQRIDATISQLEAKVNFWKTKRAETYEESKLCIAAAEEFIGVPVSRGLFP